MKPTIKDLWASNVDSKPRDYDFGQGWGESWEYYSAAECQECGKVFFGFTGEEQHRYLENDSDCEGYLVFDGPMMNYCYPVDLRDSIEESAKKLVNLPLCIVQFTNEYEEDDYYLALTGGGMDLSWEICEAYMTLGQLPPFHFCNLPRMAGRGTSAKDKWIIAGCRKTSKITRNTAYSTLQHLKEIANKEAQ